MDKVVNEGGDVRVATCIWLATGLGITSPPIFGKRTSAGTQISLHRFMQGKDRC